MGETVRGKPQARGKKNIEQKKRPRSAQLTNSTFIRGEGNRRSRTFLRELS